MILEIYDKELEDAIRELLKGKESLYMEFRTGDELDLHNKIWFTVEDMMNWNYKDSKLTELFYNVNISELTDKLFNKYRNNAEIETSQLENVIMQQVAGEYVKSKITYKDFEDAVSGADKDKISEQAYQGYIDTVCSYIIVNMEISPDITKNIKQIYYDVEGDYPKLIRMR